jgi:hypothetical protein
LSRSARAAAALVVCEAAATHDAAARCVTTASRTSTRPSGMMMLRALPRCAPGAARPLYDGSALDAQTAREITRCQAETQELWRN